MQDNINSSKKLNGKDLINTGIFTAIYLTLTMAVACTIGMLPLGYVLLSFIVPFIGGIPMMLFFSKIKKFGMLMIFQIVFGVVMILTGMGYDLLIWGIITGLIAELILKASRYQKSSACILAYAVSCISVAGNYVHWLSASEKWITSKAASYGELFMNSIKGYFDMWWVFPLLVVFCFIGGLLGGLLGKAVLKKHFIKSGLI